LGRLAGFTNQKPARRTPACYAPWVRLVHARVGLAPRGESLLQSVRQSIQPPPASPFPIDWAPTDPGPGRLDRLNPAADGAPLVAWGDRPGRALRHDVARPADAEVHPRRTVGFEGRFGGRGPAFRPDRGLWNGDSGLGGRRAGERETRADPHGRPAGGHPGLYRCRHYGGQGDVRATAPRGQPRCRWLCTVFGAGIDALGSHGHGLLANLHLALAVSTCPFLEVPLDPPGWTPARRDWLLGAEDVLPIAADGTVGAPDAPGLGATPDLDALERLRIA